MCQKIHPHNYTYAIHLIYVHIYTTGVHIGRRQHQQLDAKSLFHRQQWPTGQISQKSIVLRLGLRQVINDK